MSKDNHLINNVEGMCRDDCLFCSKIAYTGYLAGTLETLVQKDCFGINEMKEYNLTKDSCKTDDSKEMAVAVGKHFQSLTKERSADKPALEICICSQDSCNGGSNQLLSSTTHSSTLSTTFSSTSATTCNGGSNYIAFFVLFVFINIHN